MSIVSLHMKGRIFDLLYLPLFWRWPERRRHHGNRWPCEFVDHPLCNPVGRPEPLPERFEAVEVAELD